MGAWAAITPMRLQSVGAAAAAALLHVRLGG